MILCKIKTSLFAFILLYFSSACLFQSVALSAELYSDGKIIKLLEAEDFSGLERYFTSLENVKNDDGDYSLPNILLDSAEDISSGDVVRLLAALDKWCDSSPNSYYAFLLRGSVYVDYGWSARGGSWARDVSSKSWRLCHERMEMARKDLLKAHELNPKTAEPFMGLVTLSTVIGDRLSIKEYFKSGSAVQPNHLPLYRRYLFALDPKWGGGRWLVFRMPPMMRHLELMSFARESAKKSTNFLFLIGLAHEETSSYLNYLNGKKDPYFREKYFSRPEVWAEIKDAYERILKEYPNSPFAHNRLALYAYLAGEYEISRKEFMIIGSDWRRQVWSEDHKYFLQVKDFVTKKVLSGVYSEKPSWK